MKIVFQHDSPLPISRYGGIERMIFWHMKELVRQGHRPVLIGHPDSQVQAHGIELIPKSREDWHHLIPPGTDIINLFYNYAPPLDIPVVNSIGGNGKPGEKFHINTVFVSRKHAQNHGAQSFVYNALDLQEYPFQARQETNWQNFLFLAKASWKVKNLKSCLQCCQRTGKGLHIAGGRTWWPRRHVYSYGLVDNDKKIEIIRKCDALLFPVRWEEPFGLAIIEAMSQGLPVIGSPYGSLPELITQESGLIVHNQAQLEQVLAEQKSFDPLIIRQYVEENFAIERFTQAFVELFKKVLNGEKLNSSPPQWCLEQAANQLSAF